MSITEDAPTVAPSEPRSGSQSSSGAWWVLVSACALVLVLVAVALLASWVLTRETRTTSYRVLGDLAGIRLDVGDADVEIAGGATAVEVRRTETIAFGKPSEERRSTDGGRFMLTSRCPDQVLGGCRTVYRLTVPDNVPLEIETEGGSVRLSGVRATVEVSSDSGAIAATAFCGFSMRATSETGDVRAVTECSADRLELRSRDGDVRAVVPSGRYQVDAQSDSGTTRISGVTAVDDAPFQIQALSTNGDVAVEAAA